MKSIKILLACLLLSFPGFAQHSYGVKAGINYSDLNASIGNPEGRIRIAAGFYGQVRLSEYMAVQPEMIISNQGANFGVVEDEGLSFTYINFPLMLKIYPKSTGFHVHGGPQIGFLMDARERILGNTAIITNKLNTLDLGVGLGFGYDFDYVVTDIRYMFGFTNVAEDLPGTLHNRVLSFTIGVKL